KTVFFSTHILPDVEMICDRVGILVRGRLRAVGTVQDLVGTTVVASVEMVVAGLTDAGIQEAERQGGKVLRRGAQVLLRLDDPSRVDSVVELVLRSARRRVSVRPHNR